MTKCSCWYGLLKCREVNNQYIRYLNSLIFLYQQNKSYLSTYKLGVSRQPVSVFTNAVGFKCTMIYTYAFFKKNFFT